ncbi:MAG: SGNH/GDSL hydrolase family protein [Saprospiraceae bacterium]
MDKLKKIYKNLLAIFIGCVIAFVLLELILRIFQPFDFRVKGSEIVLAANQEFMMANDFIPKLDDTIFHTKNSLGFRGEEPPEDWDKATTMITIGGSTTECYYLSDDKTWQAEMNRQLKNTIPDFWINNAGLDGHSTFGHDVLVRDYIVKLKPDYALFLVGINDVATADFESFDRLAMKKINTKSVGGFFKSLANYSETIGLVFNFYRYYIAYKKGLVHSNIEFDKLKRVGVNAIKRQEILEKHKTEFLTNYQKRLERLVKTCKENQIKPILITQPQIIGDTIDINTGTDLSNIEYQDINGSTGWAILELYNDVTRQVANNQQIQLIDLANEMPKNSRYYYDYTHYTNEGAAKVGKIIATEFMRK